MWQKRTATGIQVESFYEGRFLTCLGWVILGVCVFILTVGLIMLVCAAREAEAGETWSDTQIVNAIYLAEGGAATRYPFGILSVKCDGYDECRRICFNTVRNNRKRYSAWGRKKFDTYLEFLASRYAPVGVANDPRDLNKNWLKNVRYFLNREV